MRIFFLTLCIVTALALHSKAAKIVETTPPNNASSLHEMSEWEIVIKADWHTSPHLLSEITLDMDLVSPSGKNLRLPCYYTNGASGEKSNWLARFAPREIGTYQYQFRLYVQGKLQAKSAVTTFDSKSSKERGFLMPQNNWSFKFDNGDSFRGIGYNIGWESRDLDDSKHFKTLNEESKFNYESMLDRLESSGGNFFRTWMVYWNLPLDCQTPQNNHRYQPSDKFFNESGAERLEYLIELCKDRELYFMLALQSHADFSGDGWKNNKYNATNGGPTKTPREFFTDETTKTWYKSKLRYMVARFGYSPQIAVWEFFNEVDNVMYTSGEHADIPDNEVSSWHHDMSNYLRSIDPYEHLISSSISHREVEGLNELPFFDFNQKHIYRNTDSIPSVISDFSEKFNKPYVIGEFGYEWDWSKNFNDFSDEMERDFKRGLWYGLFSPTPILPMTWWWEYFEEKGTNQYLSSVEQMNAKMLDSGKGNFQPITSSTNNPAVASMATQAGYNVFIYVYNKTQTEESFSLNVDIILHDKHLKTLQVYDCETSQYIDSQLKAISTKTGYNIEGGKLGPFSDFILITNYE